MAQRDYSKNINMSSPAERKRQDKAKRQYPGGVSIPVNLPTNYKKGKDKQCVGCKFFVENNCSNWNAEVKSEYVCNSWALEIFNTLKLETEQYAAKSLRDSINTNFSEFVKPPIDEDIEQFFQIYKEIFYDIPKRGEQSHTKLIEDSKDYVENYVDPKDTTITILSNKIEALQEQIQDEFQTQSHPFYPDGSLLCIPSGGTTPLGAGGIGIMQSGAFRPIAYWSLWEAWRDANPNFHNADGSLKKNEEYLYLFEDDSFKVGMRMGPPITSIEGFNEYNVAEPTDVLTFNNLKNSMESQSLDLAQIEILRQLLNTIAETAPETASQSNQSFSNTNVDQNYSSPNNTSAASPSIKNIY